jgi:hypothetical protein
MSRCGKKPRRTRVSRGLPPKITVLIVGEGQETEANYFDGLKRLDEVTARFTVTVRRGHGFNPESVVQEAIEHKERSQRQGKEYDEVWCILDVEGPEKRESLDRAVTLARQNDIKLCLSNPAFEVWFLAHFVRTSRAFKDCDAVIRELDKHWPQVSSAPYAKNDDRVFERLKDKLDNACKNARLVRETDHHDDNTAECNSSTEVYQLVEHLLGRVE